MPGMAEQGFTKRLVRLVWKFSSEDDWTDPEHRLLERTRSHCLSLIRKQNKKYERLPSTRRKQLNLIATYRGSDLALLRLPKSDTPTPLCLWPNPSLPKENGFPWFSHFPPSPSLERNHSRRSESFSWFNGGFTNTIPISGIGAPWFIRRSLGKSKR